ncbi:uncharacterized protein LOC114354313 [Ostrinia furnacalis]|uniref:uncharacterized protein LOC114354313 n=1 Tax=Ostrinia furnacalis TaxID=93504 RepID=UPI00103DF23F|nr:uncharacterized protein LOC114354313 [Ostrinia furnacalis]
MAYNLDDRFPPPQKSYRLLEPGAYQAGDDRKVRANKVPFLSRTPRKTQPGGQIWTHAIYDSVIPAKIPNITSLKSNRPRFPYEAFSKEDLEALLCRCGIQSSCECPTGEEKEEPEVICQGKVRKRIFKGPTPKSILGEGLSSPSKRDHGFDIRSDGSQKRLLDELDDESPPFYDATVHESTAFYHGCKWSQRTSKRSTQSFGSGPGPADYFYVKQPTDFEICAERFRSYRRQHSKQLRFIEMVQQRDLNEGRPGPATYSPMLPRGNEMQYLGPKAKRFTISTIEQRPGPADHWVKRAFELPEPPNVPCHAKLPEPSFFGIKAQRFKPRREEGPSPATYNPVYTPCHFTHCPTAAFGSSSVRFKENPVIEEDEEAVIAEDEPEKKDDENVNKAVCPSPTWEFKSKTIRMKPLEKALNEPSPADLPQQRIKINRSRRLQYFAPFFSSEGRFEPWYDWMPVLGRVKTPGPCYYCLEKPKCYPAVPHGPLFKSCRFPPTKNDNPPPNQYNVGGGIETILDTHNQRLKDNIENQHKFIWEPPVEPKRLSYEEQETILLNKSIALLDTDIFDDKSSKSCSSKSSPRFEEKKKPKLLRCFLYGTQTSHCF